MCAENSMQDLCAAQLSLIKLNEFFFFYHSASMHPSIRVTAYIHMHAAHIRNMVYIRLVCWRHGCDVTSENHLKWLDFA